MTNRKLHLTCAVTDKTEAETLRIQSRNKPDLVNEYFRECCRNDSSMTGKEEYTMRAASTLMV